MQGASFNEEFRFGSAQWEDAAGLSDAGLFSKACPQVGYYNDLPIYLAGDAPLITIAGAGAGKGRDVLVPVIINSPGQRMVVCDPKRELYSISRHIHGARDEFAYSWAPFSSDAQACNPLDILQLNDPHLHANCVVVATSLVAAPIGGKDDYFSRRAREWAPCFLKFDLEVHGYTSFPSLYRLVTMIESDTDQWVTLLERMLVSRFQDVRQTASEILVKQQQVPKEFSGIMGEIYSALSVLHDPLMRASLDTGFSLKELIDPHRVVKVFLNAPAEYLADWAPIIRTFFTVAMLYKSRAPSAERILLVVDEAGQLGRFDALLRAFTYGRGIGLRAWAVFQDVGQIARLYGQPAVQSFLGSAQMRQFFGIRDLQTAQMVSAMLGSETLEFNDVLQQEHARRQKMDAIWGALNGADPIESTLRAEHFGWAAEHRTKQARELLTPAELLALPEDRQILFISGKNLHPIFAEKYPYYTRPELAGMYLPNPYHPPYDRVPIAGRFFRRSAKIITRPVPAELAGFPQYRSGTMQYVKGFRPY